MYYSVGKRRMISKIVLVGGAFFALVFVFYNSSLAQQVLCPLSGSISLNYICPATTKSSWNLFYHLGGNGPWIQRPSENTPGKLPLQCEVEQVHMISRHAERYPTVNAGTRHLALLERLRAPGVQLSGSLAFVRDWTYFTDPDSPSFEELTESGPYAGTSQAFNTGKKLRERYGNLVDLNKTTSFWTCDAKRDIETAHYFAKAFFGTAWEEDSAAQLHIIPETSERGADTLTPGDTCLKYVEDKVNGHDRGYAELAVWQDIFTKPIAARLHSDASGLSFSPLDIYGMMELCGFEILARGSSPWCQVFSHEEWLDFEYGRDLLHFYRAGPGNYFAGAMGWLWLNATTTLMANNEASGFYASFVHDGDIIPLLATLDIFEETSGAGYLPSNRRKPDRKWKTSDVTPMGGRLVLEKVTCKNFGLGQNLKRSYVRLFINDGTVDLEKSMLGGGLANGVGMTQWLNMVQKQEKKFGSFNEVCGLRADAPSRITFLKPQYQ